jgi:sucrose phosphorylase
VLSRFKHILGIRKQQRAFAPSASQRVVATSEQLVTFVRDEQVLVAINISNQAVELDTNAVLKGVAHDLISGNDLSGVVTVQPYQVMWLAK